MFGQTGNHDDDTDRCIDATEWLTPEHRSKVLGDNALRVYPQRARRLQARQSIANA